MYRDKHEPIEGTLIGRSTTGGWILETDDGERYMECGMNAAFVYENLSSPEADEMVVGDRIKVCECLMVNEREVLR